MSEHGSFKAVFEGLVFDSQGNALPIAHVGDEPCYVLEDDGFRRHLRSEPIDRQVIVMFQEQARANRDVLTPKMMEMLGKDDLFTKIAIDDAFEKMNPEMLLANGLPEDARDMLGMAGFRIVINEHGEIVEVKLPGMIDGEE